VKKIKTVIQKINVRNTINKKRKGKFIAPEETINNNSERRLELIGSYASVIIKIMLPDNSKD